MSEQEEEGWGGGDDYTLHTNLGNWACPLMTA